MRPDLGELNVNDLQREHDAAMKIPSKLPSKSQLKRIMRQENAARSSGSKRYGPSGGGFLTLSEEQLQKVESDY
jgi:hypothetical protein